MSSLVVQSVRPGASQIVAVGAGSLQSTAFGASTNRIRIATTGACHYLLGTNPTALAASTLLPTGVVEFIEVQAGEKIAVIQDGAATGNLSVTELA